MSETPRPTEPCTWRHEPGKADCYSTGVQTSAPRYRWAIAQVLRQVALDREREQREQGDQPEPL